MRFPPPVVIERVIFNHRSFDPQSSVVVPPGKGELEFDYTALSFLAPQRVRFNTAWKGLTTSGIDAGTRRAAYIRTSPLALIAFK